MEGFELVLLNI